MSQFMISLIMIVALDRVCVRAFTNCRDSGALCDNGVQIKYPFQDGYSDHDCGYPGFIMTCSSDDQEGRPVMNISNHLYFVHHLNYRARVARIVDADVDGQECPQPRGNLSLESTPSFVYPYLPDNLFFFYNCSSYPRDMVQKVPCLDNYYNNNTGRSFAFFEDEIPRGFDWHHYCEEIGVRPVDQSESNYSLALQSGFDVSWSTPGECEDCDNSGGKCLLNVTSGIASCSCQDYNTTVFGDICTPKMENTTLSQGLPVTATKTQHRQKGLPTGVKIAIGSSIGLGLLFILCRAYRIYLRSQSFIYRWANKTKSPTNIEAFLENYGDLALQKYKYSVVKKITNSFKDVLGKGAYGCVFKGKLHDGRLVAVKVLNGSKGNGEEFINEVATIGKTNHINVVSLLGFCAERDKRALIYEFMSNGSLERFIYNDVDVSTTPSTHSLGREKLYQIALGIAKGLEYLHCLCNTRILHFDIKPHNILLDQDFCPKISDFGLAKLCPTRESVISMAGARGTVGYIAPELFCRNLGGASHKSDVYSYGMMVLEMIGGRKNIDATVENISEIYFPHWIYNYINRDINVEGPQNTRITGYGETFVDETTKKMIIVSLWCIQTHPNERPAVSKVVEMLEGNLDELQMPPNPFQDPPTRFPTSKS